MAQQFGNTQDLVPIEEIKNGTLILKDGSLRQIVMVGGINFSLKSDSEQEMITQAYQNFLNGLDFSIQIVVHSRKINIENYLKNLDARIGAEPSEVLRNQIAEYKEFIGGFVRDNPIMAKTFLVVVPFYPVGLPSKGTFKKFIPFIGKKETKAEKEKALQRAQGDFEKNAEQLRQRVNQIVEGLQRIDLDAKPLDDEELVELFYNFYNPSTAEKESVALPAGMQEAANPKS